MRKRRFWISGVCLTISFKITPIKGCSLFFLYLFWHLFQLKASFQKAGRRPESAEKLRPREQTGFGSVHGLFWRARKVKLLFLSVFIWLYSRLERRRNELDGESEKITELVTYLDVKKFEAIESSFNDISKNFALVFSKVGFLAKNLKNWKKVSIIEFNSIYWNAY